MNSNITSLLKIPGFFVTDVRIAKDGVIVSARKRSKTARCPLCNKRSKKLHDYLKVQKVHINGCFVKIVNHKFSNGVFACMF